MRKLLTLIIVSLLSAGNAYAADLNGNDYTYRAKPKLWTTCYLGIGAGTERVTHDISPIAELAMDGQTVEGQLGCGYQTQHNLVLGVWGAYGLSNTEATYFGTAVNKDWYGEIGARVGYALGRFQPYVGVSYQWTEYAGAGTTIDDESIRGHVGIDYLLNRNFSLGVDVSQTLEDQELAFGVAETADTRALFNLKYHFKSLK